MRQVPSNVIAQLDGDRKISAYAKSRKTRPVWTLSDTTSVDTPTLAGQIVNIDADIYNGKIARAACIDEGGLVHYLYIEEIPDASSPTVGEWFPTYENMYPGSKPGVFGNRVFWQDPTGSIRYFDMTFDGNGGRSETLGSSKYFLDVSDKFSDQPIAIAPVSATELYLFVFDDAYTPPWTSAKIQYRPMYSTSEGAWFGRIYSDPQTSIVYFDAVRHEGKDHIFVNDFNENRALTLYHYPGGSWGVLEPVMSIDVVDDQKYIVTGTSIINGRVFIGGYFQRETGVKMTFYSMGPDMYTTGREFLVGSTGADVFTSGGAEYPLLGGKMFVHDGISSYLGFGYTYTSPSSSIFDENYVDADLDQINNVQIGYSANEGARISMDIPGSTTLGDNEFDIYAAYNDQETLIGRFGIDGWASTIDMNGRSLSITGRSAGIKALSQWAPDVSFDLWSQTKIGCNPADLTKMVRVTGSWEEENEELILEDLNVEGVCYTTGKVSRNAMVRAKFLNSRISIPPEWDPSFTGRFGVAVNYFREEVDGDWYHNGIFATYSEKDQKIYLHHVVRDVWTELASTSMSFGENEYSWIMLDFKDGLCHVYTLESEDGTGNWSLRISFLPRSNPWPRDDVGRGAIFVENVTRHFVSSGFSSTATIIPIEEITAEIGEEVIMVDDEQILISGFAEFETENVPGPQNATLDEALDNADLGNASWTNERIFEHEWDGTYATAQNICNHTDNNHVAQSFRVVGKAKITSITVPIGKTESPIAGLYCHIATDEFDESSPPDHDSIIGSAYLAPSAISNSFVMRTFTFSTPVEVEDDHYWIVLTTAQKGGAIYIDGTNYYRVAIDTNFEGKTGLFFVHGTSSGWRARDDYGLMPFEMNGDATWMYGAHEIQTTGPGVNAGIHDFDDCALVVTSGKGEGTAFRVLAYDKQCPDDWVPSRTYKFPDTWQDHAGEEGHGAWVANTRQRYFCAESPSGIIDETSVLELRPSLIISERGYNGTIQTSHGSVGYPVDVSVYRDISVTCSRFEYFSGDVDLRFEDAAKNLARKAGVYNLTSRKLHNAVHADVHDPSEDWRVEDITETFDRKSFIVKIRKISANGTPCVAFGYDKETMSGGYIVLLRVGAYAELFTDISNPTISVRVPIPNLPEYNGEVTYSYNNGFLSIWADNLHVATFTITPALPTLGFCSYYGCSYNVDLSETDMRIDNFIFDAGTRGSQLMQRLVGEKRIRFQDDNAGGIYVWRTYQEVPGEYNLAVSVGQMFTDIDIVTRLQSEGIDIAEQMAENAMSLFGNLYQVINLNEMETEDDMNSEAAAIMSETNNSSTKYMIVGAADPRWEPGDIVTVNLPGETVSLALEDVTFIITLNDNEALFDMEATGHPDGLYD